MMPDIEAPSIKDVSVSAFTHILSIYPDVLKSFYKDKVKGDNRKRDDAYEDDDWRYGQLPSEIRQRLAGQGISKEELERLVKWKITHQTYRPFLLPQIRKNDPSFVEQCTADARDILLAAHTATGIKKASDLPRDQIRKALDRVCKVTGVGPATGTLILSIFDSQNIPFFEDELYAWLHPDFGGKLKYNNKEYFEMLDRLQQSPLPESEAIQKAGPIAEAFEKVAFVCGHWSYVGTDDRTEIQKLTTRADESTSLDDRDHDVEDPHEEAREVHVVSKKRKDASNEVAAVPVRRSKRRKT